MSSGLYSAIDPSGPVAYAPVAADAVYRKVALRPIPFLFLCYVAAYLDRINVGFAQLQTNRTSA